MSSNARSLLADALCAGRVVPFALALAACASPQNGAAPASQPSEAATKTATVAAAVKTATAAVAVVEPVKTATSAAVKVEEATKPSAAPEPQKPLDPRGKIVVTENATEGPRKLDDATAAMKKVVLAQPYGKAWKDAVHTAPAPKDQTGLGKAETHPALANDPIELQQQVQFLEETGVEARYGFVSIRGVRVWRYGKLAGVRVVLERIGKDTPRDVFTKDVDAIAAVWRNVPVAWSLGSGFKMVKNDLIEQKALKPAEYPKAPLVIELVPMERGG
ncbi:hypothetical protein L6R52_15610 [Myxococcota bacterium]|nr:hypothetical protein [Myxococcota bacterium]